MLQEGRLQIELPPGVRGRKFDDESHGLSHAMKAVDFIIEQQRSIWLLEIKDPTDPDIPKRNRANYIKEFISGRLDMDLVHKYRDSWLYLWASGKVDTEIECRFFVIISYDSLDSALLIRRTDALRTKLPIDHPHSTWSRQFVSQCMVFNLKSWNEQFEDYLVTIT